MLGNKLNKLNTAITTLVDGTKEMLWPTRCIGCDSDDGLLCKDCMQSLSWIEQRFACPVCGSPYGYITCTECARDWETTSTISAFTYKGVAARLITSYKDDHELRLAPVLSAAILCALEEASAWDTTDIPINNKFPKAERRILLDKIDAVTFIPATKAAYERRGFDHMELVAKDLAAHMNCEVADALVHHQTQDQRELGKEDRAKNMQGSFSVIEDVSGANLLLIDDVITTGASIREATRALLARGAASIHAASVARTW